MLKSYREAVCWLVRHETGVLVLTADHARLVDGTRAAEGLRRPAALALTLVQSRRSWFAIEQDSTRALLKLNDAGKQHHLKLVERRQCVPAGEGREAAMNPPRLNPDGYSVKNASYIYAPRGQAGEYSKLAANPYRGCGHGCAYCYVPDVIRMTREEFDAGAQDRKDFRRGLRRDAAKYQALGVREQVMLSFTTDPYHQFDTSLTRETIEVLIEHGLDFCTLTKGGRRALRDLDLFRPARDAFASSLTLLDADASERWEPGAAPPADRIATLERFRAAGLFTWVSLEPVIEPEATLELIRITHPFVDLFKLGRMNHDKLTHKIDWHAFTDRALDVFARTGATHYIKKDLQPHLPRGYQNDRYRPQRRELPVLA